MRPRLPRWRKIKRVKTNDATTILPCWPLFTRTRKAGNMPFSYLIGKSLLWLWNCLDSYPYETTENSTYSFLCCLPSALNERLCGGRLDSLWCRRRSRLRHLGFLYDGWYRLPYVYRASPQS